MGVPGTAEPKGRGLEMHESRGDQLQKTPILRYQEAI